MHTGRLHVDDDVRSVVVYGATVGHRCGFSGRTDDGCGKQLGVEARADGAVVDAVLCQRRTLATPLHHPPERDDVQSDEVDGTVDPVGRLLQLVRFRVLLRVLETLRSERTQQQRQEKIQHLGEPQRISNSGCSIPLPLKLEDFA